jgi:hypothetical protein
MADRSRLVQISSKIDDSPNCFSKGTVTKDVLDTLIPIATNTLLASFPIFSARLSLVRTTFLCRNQKNLYL